jgi:hypothetical protein
VDDPEYEVGDVRERPLLSAPRIRSQPSPPGTLLSRRLRLSLTLGTVLLAIVVIFSTWLPLRNQSQLSDGNPSPPSGLPSPTSPHSALPVTVPTPLPITSSLAPPPTNCPGSPPLTTAAVPNFGGFASSTVQMSGHTPVWIPDAYLPQRITNIPEQAPPSSAMPAWWPSIFILWEIGPTIHPSVTVQVHDLHSGEPAWWSEGGSTPETPVLVLPPPPDQPAPTIYSTYRVELFIRHAACYQMIVSWPGGKWSYIFAVGWGPTY